MMLLVLVDATLLTWCPFALYNKKWGILYLATVCLGNSTDLRYRSSGRPTRRGYLPGSPDSNTAPAGPPQAPLRLTTLPWAFTGWARTSGLGRTLSILTTHIKEAVVLLQKRNKDGLYSTKYQELTTAHTLTFVYSHLKHLIICSLVRSSTCSVAPVFGACVYVPAIVLGLPAQPLSWRTTRCGAGREGNDNSPIAESSEHFTSASSFNLFMICEVGTMWSCVLQVRNMVRDLTYWRSRERQDLNPNSLIPESTLSATCSKLPLHVEGITTEGNIWFRFFHLLLLPRTRFVTSDSHSSRWKERYCFTDEKAGLRGHVIVPKCSALKKRETWHQQKLGFQPGPVTFWLCDLGQVIETCF